jgi:hypothetical protein
MCTGAVIDFCAFERGRSGLALVALSVVEQRHPIGLEVEAGEGEPAV